MWIGVTNSTNGTGYIIHDCPFDYCIEKPVNIGLSSSQERDKQCAFNRSGVLCGECQRGLSLVLATSKCKRCSNVFLLLIIPFALAGVILVGFILLFNVTIATGTIRGLIFYANVLAANKAIFLPFSTPTPLTVFISWVNLDFGIETCFYSSMSSQAKVLLQLVFPAYLFALVFLIIILSKYSVSFSKLLSNRNPVAALCTLIFLSYSKLLQFIIAALKSTVLEFPSNTPRRVWLYDANIKYFDPSHTPQFVAAAIILTVGGFLTVMLFFSQWFPRCSRWKLMKWTRNTKYTAFMDAYHAPFTARHRYRVGLLLFALIVHNILAAMATDNFLPVLSAGSISVGLIVLKVFVNIIYKDWSKDCLKTIFLLNLTTFAFGLSNVRDIGHEHETLANISMGIAFVFFIIISCLHFYKYILTKMRVWPKLLILINDCRLQFSLRLRRANYRHVQTEMHNVTVVETNEQEDELLQVLDNNDEYQNTLNPPYTNRGEEEASTNKYHTPPNIVLATRPDQLREPDLDNLAPITADDYQPALKASRRQQAINHQGVTYTIVDPITSVT